MKDHTALETGHRVSFEIFVKPSNIWRRHVMLIKVKALEEVSHSNGQFSSYPFARVRMALQYFTVVAATDDYDQH